jgi:hypothetical protein
MGQWSGGVWNMVFVGSNGAPETHCGNKDGNQPLTTVNETPVIAEKPYITFINDKYVMMVP